MRWGRRRPEVIDRAHAQGVQVAALVGRVPQAERDVQAGVDVIIAQGYEAGGHTGEVASMVLVPDVVDAIAPVPVLAAGGIGTGRQMAAAMALGAQGVWTGSIWLTVAESDTSAMIQQKLLAATSTDTVRSRAYTGKPARQLRTDWTDAWESDRSPGTLPMPLQFILNSYAMRRAPASRSQRAPRHARRSDRRPHEQRPDGQAGDLRDGRGVRRRHRAASSIHRDVSPDVRKAARSAGRAA